MRLLNFGCPAHLSNIEVPPAMVCLILVVVLNDMLPLGMPRAPASGLMNQIVDAAIAGAGLPADNLNGLGSLVLFLDSGSLYVFLRQSGLGADIALSDSPSKLLPVGIIQQVETGSIAARDQLVLKGTCRSGPSFHVA